MYFHKPVMPKNIPDHWPIDIALWYELYCIEFSMRFYDCKGLNPCHLDDPNSDRGDFWAS